MERQRLGSWLALGVAAVAMIAVAVSADARNEVMRASRIPGSGDTTALRDYILSYGFWAPLASALLMLLQALAGPLPAFLITFAKGLAFGFVWRAPELEQRDTGASRPVAAATCGQGCPDEQAPRRCSGSRDAR